MTTAAVVGCGDVSVVHLRAVADLAGIDLVGVCDTDADRAAAAGRRYGVPWFTGHRELLDVVGASGHSGRYALDGAVDVEDTAHVLLDHAGGARSVVFATLANVTDSPVTVEIVTEQAVLLIRGDLTVSHADGRTETVAERRAESGGRAYWGTSHELLIADVYRTLPDPEPFWIGPREGARSLRLVDRIYRQNS